MADAGVQHTYVPSIPSFRLDNLDPAYVMQLQFQMHATGAAYGYICSWSRRELTIIHVPYSFELVEATAHVLVHVVKHYLDPEQLPVLPRNFVELTADHQEALISLHQQLGPVMASCTLKELRGTTALLRALTAAPSIARC